MWANKMSKVDNKKILEVASVNAELKKPLKDIFQAWPNLQDITLKLVSFMGTVLPSDKGMPLIEACLINAVNSFRDVSPFEFATEAQMVAYIKGLLVDADQIVNVSVGTIGDNPTLWEPFLNDVSEFELKHGQIRIYDTPYTKVKSHSLRLMLLSRIITAKDLFWIDKYSSLPSLLGEAA